MNMTPQILTTGKRLVFIALCFMSPSFARSQANNGLAFPSANNTFLGAAGNIGTSTGIGVDLYSGTAQINVPICNLVSKELTIPVSLSYIGARGIRIQDYAGSAGLGWALSAGGGISRVVRCFPDEQANGYLGTGALPSGAIGTGGQWGKLVAGNLGPSNTPLTSSQYTALAGGISGTTITPPTADGEPDLFYVKTPFFAFEFTFDENGNPVFPNSTGMQIITSNFYNSSNYGRSSFEVIDGNGTQYYFGSSSASVETTSTTLLGSSYAFPTTWYLDKIVTANGKDVINLTYLAASHVDITNHYTGTATFDQIGNQVYDTTHPITNTISPKYVSSISCASGEIDFTYAFDRTDDTYAARLATVVLNAYNPLYSYFTTFALQTFTFNYGYFGSPSTDPNVLRLKLNNITVAGNTSATSTPLTLKTFTYNTASTMPSRNTFSFSDYWGYFNFQSPMTFTRFPFNVRTPLLAAATTDILTSVKDVTGGTWNISYELNSYYNTSTSGNTTVGGLRVSGISRTLPTGESLSTSYVYNDGTGRSTGQILSTSYNINTFSAGTPYNGVVTEFLSESPSEYCDLNGDFFGYSSVKAVEQNGGYTVSNFTNFSDFPDVFNYFNGLSPSSTPDITSSISLAYKRGLLLDQTVYNAAGSKISEDVYPLATAYTSLTSPVAKRSWAYKWNVQSYSVPGAAGTITCGSSYWGNVEDFRLTTAKHIDYDQVTPANSIQSTSTYVYDATHWLVDRVTTTDSKGAQYVKQFYYTADPGIPMTTAGENTAISNMLTPAVNRRNVLIHETDTKNGVTSQVHNSYGAFTVGNATKVELKSTTKYSGSTQIRQELYNYDPASDNLISSGIVNGKPTGIGYGYNLSQPVAKVVNAAGNATAALQTTPAFYDLSFTGGSGQTTFTTFSAGNIVLTIDGSVGYTYTLNYYLTGPSSSSGSLCAQRSATTCSYPSSVTLSNMPAGTYTLSASQGSGSAPTEGIGINYNGSVLVTTPSNEFFYEGFEENNSAMYGTGHTGVKYWYTGNYTVPYTPPNGRSYVIQWWNWVNGQWIFHEQPYTANMVLTGILDDVRVFPSDALMTTYTYAPQVGMTSQIDPAGRATVYQYDGLGRINLVRDNDGNILRKYCYNYAGQSVSCASVTVYSNVAASGTFTRNNCSAGYVPGSATYTVPAGTYTSTLSQGDADQQAANDIALNGQAYANAHGTCTQTWYNVARSGSYTRNNCGTGYAGSTVVYTVVAGAYSSTISQADADQKAINDVTANGQNYANTNGTCTSTGTLTYGDLVLTGGSASVTISATAVGDIVLTIDGSTGYTYSLNYSLSGPSAHSGTLCAQRSATACSYPSTVTFSAMPTGTYTLSISAGSGSAPSKSMSYSYYK